MDRRLLLRTNSKATKHDKLMENEFDAYTQHVSLLKNWSFIESIWRRIYHEICCSPHDTRMTFRVASQCEQFSLKHEENCVGVEIIIIFLLGNIGIAWSFQLLVKRITERHACEHKLELRSLSPTIGMTRTLWTLNTLLGWMNVRMWGRKLNLEKAFCEHSSGTHSY